MQQNKGNLLPMIGPIEKKDPPPEPVKKENKKCKFSHKLEKIEEKFMVEILTINNGNCFSIKPGDKVKVENMEQLDEKTLSLMLAGYWLKIPQDCTVRIICSSCGKPISDSSVGVVKKDNSSFFLEFHFLPIFPFWSKIIHRRYIFKFIPLNINKYGQRRDRKNTGFNFTDCRFIDNRLQPQSRNKYFP